MNVRLKTAFTLVELLVVIAIIGILSGLIIVGMSSSTQSALIAKSQIFSASLRDSLLSNLVSEWKFDGNTNDSWGANGGTWNGSGGGANTSASWRSASECVYNQCLNFDGTDDYVDFGGNVSLDVIDKTIDFWFKTSTNMTGVIGQAGGTGQWLLTIRSNKLIWDTWATGLDMQGVTNITDNKWHNFVVSISDTNDVEQFYLDGNLERQDTTTVTTPAATGNLFIGSCSAVAGSTWCTNLSVNNFNGNIDNLRIYSNSKPASKIREDYYSGIRSLFSKGKIDREEYQNRISNLGKEYNYAYK